MTTQLRDGDDIVNVGPRKCRLFQSKSVQSNARTIPNYAIWYEVFKQRNSGTLGTCQRSASARESELQFGNQLNLYNCRSFQLLILWIVAFLNVCCAELLTLIYNRFPSQTQVGTLTTVSDGYKVDMSANAFFNPIPSHSQ